MKGALAILAAPLIAFAPPAHAYGPDNEFYFDLVTQGLVTPGQGTATQYGDEGRAVCKGTQNGFSRSILRWIVATDLDFNETQSEAFITQALRSYCPRAM